jgi:ribosomal protein S1
LVVGYDSSILQLVGEPPNAISKCFYSKPISEEAWENFTEKNNIEDIIEVQNLFWSESSHSFIVVTVDGFVCMLPSNEVDWTGISFEDRKFQLKPGDIFHAKIIKINLAKKRIILSKKSLVANPIDRFITQINLGDLVEGVIVKIFDYGYFVSIYPYGVQALLHRSKILDGKSFKVGDSINAFIDGVDQLNKRISVRI